LFRFFFFLVYSVEARGRARTQNGSGGIRTKRTIGKKGRHTNSRVEGQNRGRLGEIRVVGKMRARGYTQYVNNPTTEGGTIIIDHVYGKNINYVAVKVMPNYLLP